MSDPQQVRPEVVDTIFAVLKGADPAELPADATREGGSRFGAAPAMVAEDRGFEPLRALTQPAFQASAIGH